MSEREKLEQFIGYVQRAVMNAPDEATRMLRLFVLALAQGELAVMIGQVGDCGQVAAGHLADVSSNG